MLWKNDRNTVREVHDQITATTGWAYTTTKTMMDRMVKKELLKREDFHGMGIASYLLDILLKIAKENPDKNVVFLGIGFETTTPSSAIAILEAVPPTWNVLRVSCVPGSPMDWAAITPTASPFWTIRPVARFLP